MQGESLQKVIVDFRRDEETGKRFIVPASFYTAITRVHKGDDLYLRSFERCFIQNERKVEWEINRLRSLRPFSKTKVYLDEEIFVPSSELKVGYLNINGLLDSLHAEYLNADKNLVNLDLLCVAETHLLPSTTDLSLSLLLTNWEILIRFDSDDMRKHLGLLVLRSRSSKLSLEILQESKMALMRQGQLQCQVIQIFYYNISFPKALVCTIIHTKTVSGPQPDSEVKQPRLWV